MPVTDAIWMDDGETIHLAVGEVAERAMGRGNLSQIFVSDPISSEGKRSQKERSPPKEGTREQNAKTKRSRGHDKKDNDDGHRKLERITKVGPLIQFTDQPREKSTRKATLPRSRGATASTGIGANQMPTKWDAARYPSMPTQPRRCLRLRREESY